MEQPLVSVITVTYNSSAYARDAIESVLAQTHKNIEYIIGDDYSTDNTWSIITGYRDERIKAYRNESNLGEYENRNKAIAEATGKYLVFIDGDDIIFPHGVAFFVSQMEAFPEAAFAVQKNYYNNLLFPALFQPKETIADMMFGNNLLVSSFASNFFRTELLQKEGSLSTRYKTGDDEIRFRLACKYPVLFVAGWVSWPRETPGQASSNLQNGIGLTEFCNYFEETIATKPEIFSDPVFEKNIRTKLLQAKINIVKLSIKKLQCGMAITQMKDFGISWLDLFRTFNNKIPGTDMLSNYNAASPLKKGFLKRGV